MTESELVPHMSMDMFQHQEMKFDEGSRAIYDGLEIPEGSYGISDMTVYERMVDDSLQYEPMTLLLKRALPNSGKSLVIGQEADRIRDRITNKKINKRMLYLGWGPFALSVIKDPTQFGHIGHMLPEISRKFASAVEQIMEIDNVAAIIEVPVGRGNESVEAAVEEYGIVHNIYADESMRQERLDFRRAIQQITTVKELIPLLQQYNINPFTSNGKITKQTLDYFKKNGATVDGVIAVDNDVNAAIAPLLSTGLIDGLPSYFQRDVFSSNGITMDVQVSELLRGNPLVRTEVIKNYLDFQAQHEFRVPRERALLTYNPPVESTKDLRQDLLSHIAVPLLPGGEIDLRMWKRRRTIYFTP